MRSNVAVDVKHIVDAFAYTVAIKNLSIYLSKYALLVVYVGESVCEITIQRSSSKKTQKAKRLLSSLSELI